MASIGLFTYSTKPRGSVVHATHLAEALQGRGHAVTLYALSKAGDRLYRELTCPVVHLRAQPASQDPDALIAQRVAEVAAGARDLVQRHDLFHAEDCLVGSGLLRVRSALGGAPIVRTLHHFEHFESPYLRECQRRSILDADAVVCVSRLGQRDVQRELGRWCPIIGNGVDAARFSAGEELRTATRRRLGLESGDPIVLSVGGVEPRKNSLRALEAMSAALQKHPSLRWLLVGGASIWEHDAYRSAFAARVAALPPSVATRIIELGCISENELYGVYAISQILLCPSLQEGFGLCVLEALASGAAVIVSNSEPFTEYLPPSSVCFVDPESPAAIGSAIERLLSDPEERARLATQGHAIARRYSWEGVALEHERLYDKVLEARRTLRHGAHPELVHA